MLRRGEAERRTREVQVEVELKLDGEGSAKASTGVPFLDHMLTTLATHSMMDLSVKATGDLVHHTMEDVALCLGEALKKALGKRVDIARFGYATVPMDDALASASIDLAKRPYCVLDLKLGRKYIEGVGREGIHHFLRSLAHSAEATIHISVNYGEDDHHKVEAAVKALALSLRRAASPDPKRRGAPSAKGVL